MIILYSGTPGSGKSLHAARTILNNLRSKNPVIANFPISKEDENFHFVDKELTVKYLINFSKEYFSNHKYKEGKIKVFIDEAQLLFNCRDFQKKGRDDWISFFTQHRHLGFDIIFMCQFQRMLDRQIRSLIEYEYLHRKVSNFGWKGKLISTIMLHPLSTFCCVKIWAPLNEKVDAEWFFYNKRLGKLYDTNRLFDNLGKDFKEESSIVKGHYAFRPAGLADQGEKATLDHA